MSEQELAKNYLLDLINNSNKTPHARDLYFELLGDKSKINSIYKNNIELNEILKNKLPIYNKDNKFLNKKDTNLYNKLHENDLLVENEELSINIIGISFKKEIEKETPNIEKKLESRTNGVYIGMSYDHLYNAKVIQSKNNEHLILIHSGLMQTCYLLSHIAMANMKISQFGSSTVDKNEVPEHVLVHHSFSFFRKIIRSEINHNFSDLKFSSEATNLIFKLTSSAEKFIIKHEYAHIINGDFDIIEGASDDQEKELLADEVATLLILSSHLGNNELSEDELFYLQLDIAGIYLGLVSSYIIMQGIPGQEHNYYLSGLERWDKIKKILSKKIDKSNFHIQVLVERNIHIILEKTLHLLKGFNEIAEYGRGKYSKEEFEEIDDFLLSLTEKQTSHLINIVHESTLISGNDMNYVFYEEVSSLRKIIKNEGEAMFIAFSYSSAHEDDRADLIFSFFEKDNAEIKYSELAKITRSLQE